MYGSFHLSVDACVEGIVFYFFSGLGKRIGNDHYDYSVETCGIGLLLNNGVAGSDRANVTIFDCKNDQNLWETMKDYENDREIVLMSKENKVIDHRPRFKSNVASSMAVNGACQICGSPFTSMYNYNRHLKDEHMEVLGAMNYALKDVVVCIMSVRLTARFQLNEFKLAFLTSNNVDTVIELRDTVIPRPWTTDVDINVYFMDRVREMKKSKRDVTIVSMRKIFELYFGDEAVKKFKEFRLFVATNLAAEHLSADLVKFFYDIPIVDYSDECCISNYIIVSNIGEKSTPEEQRKATSYYGFSAVEEYVRCSIDSVCVSW